MTSTSWSLDPLLHATLPNEVYKYIFANLSLVQSLYITALVLSVTYPIAHKILLKYSLEYNALEGRSKRIIVIHHATEGLVLSVVFPIFTYHMIKTNFQIHEELDELTWHLRSIIKCMFVFMAMYMFELSSRFDEPRPILILHHLLACCNGLLVVLFPTSIMCRTASILVYFICYEAIIFIGLFMYRIFPESQYTPQVIFAGMISFGITRPFQLLWIGTAVFGQWNDEYTVKWQALMQLAFTCILTFIQLVTLKIHYGIWKRCSAKKKNIGLDSASKTINWPISLESIGSQEVPTNLESLCNQEVDV